MSNHCEKNCNLDACNCKNNTKNTEKQLKIAEFKEKTDKIRQISYKNFKKTSFFDKNDEISPKVKNYRVTISDSSNSDGYFMEYSKDITLFEFAEILSNIFGIDIYVGYDEDNDKSLQEDIMFFNSLEEVIDFLENKKRDEQ